MNNDPKVTRRTFMKWFGAVGGSVATTMLARFAPEAQATSLFRQSSLPPNIDIPGERYSEFLLLPEGAPLPPQVQDYTYGIPTMCGVSDGEHDASLHNHGIAVHISLPNVEELAKQGQFPVYSLGKSHTLNRKASTVSLIRHDTGEVYGGCITFDKHDKVLGIRYTTISILAQVDHMRPVPLWSSSPVEEGGPGVILEKVDFIAGGPGILIRNPYGFALHWIKHEVYYMMSVDDLPRIKPEKIAKALVLVNP